MGGFTDDMEYKTLKVVWKLENTGKSFGRPDDSLPNTSASPSEKLHSYSDFSPCVDRKKSRFGFAAARYSSQVS